MAPKFSAATSVRGVLAFQDDQDNNTFHYYPQHVEGRLNENLTKFDVTYWGIGEQALMDVDGEIFDSVGAVLSGEAKIDITQEQRDAIVEEIKKDYHIEEPKLLPLSLTDVRVTPIFAEKALSFKNGDKQFPDTLQFGTSFNYLLGCAQNSTFASFIGAEGDSGELTTSSFGINIVGKAEFVGDPWIVEVEANLSQVWKYIKKKYSGEGRLGWFKIADVDFQKTIVDMDKESAFSLKFKEGSLENEAHGRQIFDLGKQIFEGLDKNGDYFKFEPIPKVDALGATGFFGLGWNVSINGSYLEAEITQTITYKNTINYQGRFKADMPASMSLGINCNAETANHFRDLIEIEEPCITPDKMKKFQARRKKAHEEQESELKDAYNDYKSHKDDYETYMRRVRIIKGQDPLPTFKAVKNSYFHDSTKIFVRVNPFEDKNNNL